MNRRHIPEEKVDLHVVDQGTIFLLEIITEAGAHWVAENIDASEGVWTLRNSIVVEHRYIHDIVEGAIADGLKVQGAS
jgi:hypothetical protein